MHNHYLLRPSGYCLSAAVLLALVGSSAQAGFLTKNLQICDQGDFFVGGVPKTTKFSGSVTPSTNYAQITVGQMYVEFQVPVAAKKWPMILWHGSTHSGACVKSTPKELKVGHPIWCATIWRPTWSIRRDADALATITPGSTRPMPRRREISPPDATTDDAEHRPHHR